MIQALSTAATGLEAQQAKMSDIANDLANVNTDGYKRTETRFSDLMYKTIQEPGGALGDTSRTPVGIQTGLGVRVAAGYKNFESGPARITYNPYDLMIEGPGFLPVLTPQNEEVYTRATAFHRNAEGQLQLADGSKLVPMITIPSQALNVVISPSGEVTAHMAGGEMATLGQIELVNFNNPQGLVAMGGGKYRATVAAGPPIRGIPGENGLSILQQGALEGSNVNVANSMLEMITTQRGFEMGTKVMNTADQMMAALSNVK